MSTLALKLFRRELAIPSCLNFSIPTSHPSTFNVPWPGPPVSYRTFNLPSRVGHMVSGLRHDTQGALFRIPVSLRPVSSLNSHHIVTPPGSFYKGTPLTHGLNCCSTRSLRFHFTPPGCFSPFPSRYWFTIGH